MAPTALPALVTCLALVVYVWNTMAVGQARGKFGIKAPAISGDPAFERVFRVQQNMVEQLVFFIPALWLFSTTLSSLWGAIVGLIWVAGRIIYSAAYYADAEKRGTGFLIAGVAGLVLLLGSLVGSARLLF